MLTDATNVKATNRNNPYIMIRYLTFLLNTIILVSCNNSTKPIVEINKVIQRVEFPYLIDIEKHLKRPMSVTLSSIGKKLEYIPLETNPSSIIDRIIHIEFSADYIFVSTVGNNILQFDIKGNFIRKVGTSGRGPEEYLGGAAFCIDQKNEKIFVVSAGNKIVVYNFNGEYIESFKVPWHTANKITVFDTVGLAFDISENPNDGIFSKYKICVTDYECKEIYKIKRQLIRNSNLEGTSIMYYHNMLHFKEYTMDTLYTFKNEKSEPYAIFNLGKKKMDPNIMFPNSDIGIDDMLKQIEENIEIRDIFENEDYVFTKLVSGLKSAKLCIFNKKTSETTILKEDGFVNDIDGGINFWPEFVFNYDSILVDYCQGNNLLNYVQNANSDEFRKKYGEKYIRLEKVVSDLDEMSNPVLIILHY